MKVRGFSEIERLCFAYTQIQPLPISQEPYNQRSIKKISQHRCYHHCINFETCFT